MGTKKKSTFGNEEFAMLIYTQNYERTSVEAKKERLSSTPHHLHCPQLSVYGDDRCIVGEHHACTCHHKYTVWLWK